MKTKDNGVVILGNEKILHLTLKKKWFDMIASGEKKEEYRECKPYWYARLCCGFPTLYSPKDYDFILFKNGYGKNAPTMKVECLGISRGEAKPEWSDNWEGTVYIIKLGKVFNTLSQEDKTT